MADQDKEAPKMEVRCPCGKRAVLEAPDFDVNIVGMLQFRCGHCGTITNAPDGLFPNSMHWELQQHLLAWLGVWRDKFDPQAVRDLQNLLGGSSGRAEKEVALERSAE